LDSGGYPLLFFLLSIGMVTAGGLMYIIPQLKESPPGIRNNHIFFKDMTSRGAIAWVLGVAITGFYVLLYWFPDTLKNWIRLTDPLRTGGPLVPVRNLLHPGGAGDGRADAHQIPPQPLPYHSDFFGNVFPTGVCIFNSGDPEIVEPTGVLF